MKKLFVSVLAIAAAVACNNAEVLDVPTGAPIQFDNAFVQNASRADVVSTTKETLDAFDVWAYIENKTGIVLTDEDVKKGNGQWGYSNLQYWAPGHAYYFKALAPMNSTNWEYIKTDDVETDEVSFINVDGSEDLLYAYATASTAGKNPGDSMEAVKLTFNHLLAKVDFQFTNGFATENVKVNVKNVKMTAVKSAKVALNGEAATWSNHDGEFTLEFRNVLNVLESGKSAVVATDRLVIPTDAAYEYTISFDVDVYYGEVLTIEDRHFETKLKGVALELGKAYNLSATINQENLDMAPIVFEVTDVEGWVESNDPDSQAKEAEFLAAVAFGGEVTLSEDLTIETGSFVTSNLTLNLNGHTLNYTGDDVLFRVKNGATVTINGSEDSAIVTNPTTYAGDSAGNGYVALVSEGATLNINGGSYDAQETCTIVQVSNGTLNVYGGTFQVDLSKWTDANGEASYLLNCSDANYKNGTAVINVYGGEFVAFNPANNAAEGANTNFVAEGYAAAVNADGNYVVLPFSGNVTLAEDLTLPAPIQVTSDLVLDLNGKELSYSTTYTPGMNGAQLSVLVVDNGATLTIKNGTINGLNECYYGIYAKNGTLNIESGVFSADCSAVQVAEANVNIYGGKFSCIDSDKRYVINCLDANYKNGTAVVKVYGGEFEAFNPADNASEGNGTNYVAEGYKTILKDGSYFVVAEGVDAVAENTNELKAAIANNTTIVLTEGTYSLSSLSGKEGVVLIGEEGTVVSGGSTGFGSNFGKNTTIKNVTFSGSTNGVRWSYAQGGESTFENCTFAGGSTYGFHIDESKGATFTFNNCVFSGFNAFAGDLVSITFNNCTFEHNGSYGHTNIWSVAHFNNCTWEAGTSVSGGTLYFNGVEENWKHSF